MNKKRAIIILIAAIIIIPFLAKTVLAQEFSPIKTVLNLFADNFGFLLTKDFRTELMSEQGEAFVFVKMLLAILLIYPLYTVLKILVGEKHNAVAAVTAVSIGLLSIMFIPAKTVITIASTYGTVATIFFYALPIGAVYFFYRLIHATVEKKSKALGAFVELLGMITGVGFTQQLNKRVSEFARQNPALGTIISTEWIILLYVVFVVGAIWAVFKLVAHYKSDSNSIYGEKGWKSIKKVFSGKDEKEEENLKKTVDSETNEIAAAMNEMSQAENEFSSHIRNVRGLSSGELQQLEGIETALRALGNGIDAVKDMYRSLIAFRATIVPEPMKSTTLRDMNSKITQKSAEVQTNYGRVSTGFNTITANQDAKIRELQRSETDIAQIRTDVEKIEKDMVAVRAVLDGAIAKNQNAINANPSDPQVPTWQKVIADCQNYKANLEVGIATVTNTKNEVQSLLNKTSNGRKDTEKFKNKVANLNNKITNSVSKIQQQPVTEDDYRHASADIISAANDISNTNGLKEELNKIDSVEISEIEADYNKLKNDIAAAETNAINSINTIKTYLNIP